MSGTTTKSYKPSKEEIQAAQGRTLIDVIAPRLKVLFCGINPSLYSAAVGHHFARPGNRFWKMLHDADFTPNLLLPSEEKKLLEYGYGITDIVERATAGANEITQSELIAGVQHLTNKVLQYKPKCLAVLGIGAYRKAFTRPHAEMGRQMEAIGESTLWVLPNPSALNGHYQPEQLKQLSGELYKAIGGWS
jgi:TDG/mug DNA glycosylase family protein